MHFIWRENYLLFYFYLKFITEKNLNLSLKEKNELEMKQSKFSILKRILSFKFAFQGVKLLFKEEHNSWVHLMFTALAIFLAVWLKISLLEWILLVFCIGFVFAVEIINTAIENVCDFISPERHPMIKKIKDLSAAATLFSAITSLIVGVLIFLPKLIDKF